MVAHWITAEEFKRGMIPVLDGNTGEVKKWLPKPRPKWDENDQAAADQAAAISRRPRCSYGKKVVS